MFHLNHDLQQNLHENFQDDLLWCKDDTSKEEKIVVGYPSLVNLLQS
jgi:hypothetical protein